MSQTHNLPARSPFAGLQYSTAGGGVSAVDRHALAIVRIVANPARRRELSQRIQARIGVGLPFGPARVSAEDVAFIGVGADAWLAVTVGHHDEFAASLQEVTADLGSVVDQVGAYGVLRLSGPRVREALAKLIGIDLHPREFQPDSAAVTAAGHIAIVLWRLPDSTGGEPCFEVAVARSLAVSFWEMLTASAAEFGFSFDPAG